MYFSGVVSTIPLLYNGFGSYSVHPGKGQTGLYRVMQPVQKNSQVSLLYLHLISDKGMRANIIAEKEDGHYWTEDITKAPQGNNADKYEAYEGNKENIYLHFFKVSSSYPNNEYGQWQIGCHNKRILRFLEVCYHSILKMNLVKN